MTTIVIRIEIKRSGGTIRNQGTSMIIRRMFLINKKDKAIVMATAGIETTKNSRMVTVTEEVVQEVEEEGEVAAKGVAKSNKMTCFESIVF